MIPKEELLKWQTDEEFQLKMINKNYNSIQWIHDPSEKVMAKSIEIEEHCIVFFKHIPENIQLQLIHRNIYAIRYIREPTLNVLNELININNLEDLDNLIRYVDIIKYPEIYEKYMLLKM